MPPSRPSRPPSRPQRRLRRRLRSPAPFWLLAAALAALTGLTVSRLVGDAQAEVARYGELRPTLVTRDLRPGDTVADGDTEVRPLPAGMVPAGALDAPVDGQVVAAAVHAGEAVVGARLGRAGRSATAALLPPGTLGLAVPTAAGALRLERGDVVEVLATLDAGLAPAAGDAGPEPTFPVARGSLVVDVSEDSVTVAVSEREAPRVAFALAAGAVTLALSAGPPAAATAAAAAAG